MTTVFLIFEPKSIIKTTHPPNYFVIFITWQLKKLCQLINSAPNGYRFDSIQLETR